MKRKGGDSSLFGLTAIVALAAAATTMAAASPLHDHPQFAAKSNTCTENDSISDSSKASLFNHSLDFTVSVLRYSLETFGGSIYKEILHERSNILQALNSLAEEVKGKLLDIVHEDRGVGVTDFTRKEFRRNDGYHPEDIVSSVSFSSSSSTSTTSTTSTSIPALGAFSGKLYTDNNPINPLEGMRHSFNFIRDTLDNTLCTFSGPVIYAKLHETGVLKRFDAISETIRVRINDIVGLGMNLMKAESGEDRDRRIIMTETVVGILLILMVASRLLVCIGYIIHFILFPHF